MRPKRQKTESDLCAEQVASASRELQAALTASLPSVDGSTIRSMVVLSVYASLTGYCDRHYRVSDPSMPEFCVPIGVAVEMIGVACSATLDTGERRASGAHYTPRSMAAKVVADTLSPLLEQHTPSRVSPLTVCDPACGGGVFLVEAARQLSGYFHQDQAKGAALAALLCCYGVDKDPVAVLATKLALRLECRAFDAPVDWLDDNIKHGDALVGLSRGQLNAFHWDELKLMRKCSAGIDRVGPAINAEAERIRKRRGALADAICRA